MTLRSILEATRTCTHIILDAVKVFIPRTKRNRHHGDPVQHFDDFGERRH